MHRVPTTRTAIVLLIAGLFMTTIACVSLLQPAPAPHVPSAKPLPTSTALPLYQQVKLESAPFDEQGQPFGYRITAQVPVLLGSDDPRIKAFNSSMSAKVRSIAADFKQKLANLPPAPDSQPSTLEMRFSVLSAPGNILSLRFDTQTYFTGAAHPADTSQTVTFDLEQGRELRLGDLFTPGADFLAEISKYCIAQLNARDIGFESFELGATADPGNYKSWNITPGGLLITFDEYQVAPYAAGPQTVVIPYGELAQLIRADGPLASYSK